MHVKVHKSFGLMCVWVIDVEWGEMQESLYKKDFFFKRQKKSLRSLSCDIFPAVQSLISHMPTLL